MENPPDPDGVGSLLVHAQQPRHRFAKLTDALGVTKCLAITLVNDAALHDVRVTQPRIELALFLHARPINQKRRI